MRVWHVRETGGCERLDAFALAVDKVAVVLFAVGVGEGALAMHLALLHRAGVEHRAGGSSTTYRARQAEHACARERRSLGKRRKACKGRAKQMYVRCVRCLKRRIERIFFSSAMRCGLLRRRLIHSGARRVPTIDLDLPESTVVAQVRRLQRNQTNHRPVESAQSSSPTVTRPLPHAPTGASTPPYPGVPGCTRVYPGVPGCTPPYPTVAHRTSPYPTLPHRTPRYPTLTPP